MNAMWKWENKTWQRRQTEHISSDQNVGEVEHGVSWTPPPFCVLSTTLQFDNFWQ